MQNYFTPAFGGLPQVFFGRKEELDFARTAIENPNSPFRAFFITGNRGCGKTTLLERISRLARDARWMTIDVHSTHAARAVVEALAEGSQTTIAKSVSPSAVGVKLGSVSSSTTRNYSEASLGQLLADRCQALVKHKGILITVDEVQKVPEQDAESLCAGAQLTLRKGLPFMLVLAGLPGSKERIASYQGCTFMQRAYDMRIGSLQVDETLEALGGVFNKMPEIAISDQALWEAGLFSQGYPYLMQLVGYHVVERAHGRVKGGTYCVEVGDVREVEPIALETYRENVLVPVLDPLSASLASYLRAMCAVEDDDGRVSTGDVARELGVSHSAVSSYRQRLIGRRLIEADGTGYVRFLLPHVRDYYQRPTLPLEERDASQQWNRYRR